MPRKNKATRPMQTPWIENGYLVVRFHDGLTEYFAVPKSRDDKVGIGNTRDAACAWARQNGASSGQEDGIKKALTDAGYYLVGPRGSRSRFRTRPALGPQELVSVSL